MGTGDQAFIGGNFPSVRWRLTAEAWWRCRVAARAPDQISQPEA